MDANARIDTSVMEMPFIGDSLLTSQVDENGKMLAEFATFHNIRMCNALVGGADCWTYTGGTVLHRTGYIGMSASWFQATVGFRVFQIWAMGYVKKTTDWWLRACVANILQRRGWNVVREILGNAEPGPWEQEVNSQYSDVMRQ
eukprot:7166404-Pyramimonas_sp.AAC.1